MFISIENCQWRVFVKQRIADARGVRCKGDTNKRKAHDHHQGLYDLFAGLSILPTA
jgi:hypothetical protein